jgi:HD-GYP domain-containing protein (c-di-GMP phosphodiesterase class II)
MEAFGTPFALWQTDTYGNWTPVSAAGNQDSQDILPPDSETRNLLEAIGDDEPQVCDLATAEVAVAIPLARRVVAVGNLPAAPHAFVIRLAKIVQQRMVEVGQLERLGNEHESFLVQVTNDLEALTFLIGTTNLLEITELSFDLAAMARRVLPILRPVIKAETLALIAPLDSAASPRVANEEVSAEQLSVVYTDGADEIAPSVRLQLAATYLARCTDSPFVANNFAEGGTGQPFPGVREFVLTPVLSRDRLLGWLLALNREVFDYGPAHTGWRDLNDLEFGTHEANLLSSTAAVFGTHAGNIELVRERESLHLNVVRTLVSTIEAKDEYTRGHSERVALYARRLGAELGLTGHACSQLYLAGLLHDVGKIGVRDAVLLKSGSLDDAELDVIKRHPELGWEILSGLKLLEDVLPAVLHHHERFDGMGYPDGLQGEAIPLSARIIAVADSYDAMTSDRPYRPGMPMDKAAEILQGGKGRQWSPDVVEALVRSLPDILRIQQSYKPVAAHNQRRRVPAES